jgi:hypothetical protein
MDSWSPFGTDSPFDPDDPIMGGGKKQVDCQFCQFLHSPDTFQHTSESRGDGVP